MSCPDENVLVAMAEQQLDGAAFVDVEVHIDSCEQCRRLVAAAVADRSIAIGTPPDRDELEPLAAIIDVSINGRFVIDAVLGRGGMGTVYLARDLSLGREVALKLHRAGSGNDRLHREAIAMAKLAHPNVVTVFEVGTVDDRLYVAMEYVRGETLRGWLTAARRSWRAIIDLLLQAGQGLVAAHAAGLVHRDFKPENVLVGEDGRPRVGDFGLARVGKESSGARSVAAMATMTMTQTGALMGTPAYMAPEQIAGDDVDARTDQFAFCVVAWEALFGKRPYAGATLAALEDAMHRGELQRPTRSAVPQRVRDVLERGLAFDPAKRHANVSALLAALRAAARPRTTKYLALGIGATLVVGAASVAGVSFIGAQRHAAQCEAIGDDMRAVFDVAKREDMRRAFIASGSPMAVSSFSHVTGVIDRYRDSLATQARALCRGLDEPLRMTNARRSCLSERRAELAQLLDVFAAADRGVVSRAPAAAWQIFDPSPCDDPAMLLAQPLVSTQTLREQAIQLGRVKALNTTGRYEQALAIAQPLLDQARARKDKSFELSVLMTIGELRSELDDPEVVVPLYHEAVELAESLGRDREAAVALANLAHVTGVVQHQFVPAHQYIALARAKVERLGGGNLAVRGQLLATEGQILADENRNGEAERVMRQAITTLEQAYGPDHPNVGAALGTLGQILRVLDKRAEALAVTKRTLDLFTKALGPDHPTVAGAEMTLAQLLIDEKQFNEARERLLRADAVFARVFGEDHPVRASAAANLADIELQQEHWDAAGAHYRRALAIIERTLGPESDAASAVHADLARVLAESGRMVDAVGEQQRAIDILVRLGPDGEPRMVVRLTELAEYQLHVKRIALALSNAERAVALATRRAGDANPEELADAQFLLARALWDNGRDKARAHELATQAQPNTNGAMRTTVDAWLRDHPKP